MSLGTDWIENERFELVFAKTIILVPKTGSINSDTGHFDTDPDPRILTTDLRKRLQIRILLLSTNVTSH
jgi:hypothetical protein